MRFFGFVVPVFKAGFLIEREEYWESCDGFWVREKLDMFQNC
jgi:hypothetical protein